MNGLLVLTFASCTSRMDCGEADGTGVEVTVWPEDTPTRPDDSSDETFRFDVSAVQDDGEHVEADALRTGECRFLEVPEGSLTIEVDGTNRAGLLDCGMSTELRVWKGEVVQVHLNVPCR